MRFTSLMFSGVFILGGTALASTIDNNPFLKPSERIILTEEEKNPKNTDECEVINDDCREFMLQEIIVELEKEAVLEVPPHLQPEVLGKWTRTEVEESAYMGETNGIKVYFNERLKQYIYLDLSKAKSKGHQ